MQRDMTNNDSTRLGKEFESMKGMFTDKTYVMQILKQYPFLRALIYLSIFSCELSLKYFLSHV